MKTTRWLSLVAPLALLSCSSIRPPPDIAADEGEPPPWFDSRIDSLVSAELRRFRGGAEFEQYRKNLHELAVRHDAWWVRALPGFTTELVAAIDGAGAEPACDPAIQECGLAAEEITVSGSRVAPQSITNNQ